MHNLYNNGAPDVELASALTSTLNDANDAVLLAGPAGTWTGAELHRRVADLAALLRERFAPGTALGILADNSPDWIVADLATRAAGLALVPLPSFFTPAQWAHALQAAQVQALFCAQAGHAAALGYDVPLPCPGGLVLQNRADAGSVALPGIQKVTFTSGTTAQPKGVCLTAAQQWELAATLRDLLAPLGIRRHLNLLPLPVLLENIAGLYTALLSGATNICLPLAQVGLSGASGFDAQACLGAIAEHGAESVILLPQMLHALVAAAQPGDARLATLKFIAVGGARTPPALIAAARAKGFPVYEGYGLSECGSVVALNLPGADRVGSAGRPLPNRRVRIAADGEIEVGGGTMAGYLGAPAAQDDWLPTGDLGRLDADGFLHVDGRKKNVLITAYGRNVSPEWPETALLGAGAGVQAVVFGDAQPYLVAAIVPARADVPDALIAAAVTRANADLPDYAQVRRWFRAAPFTPADGTATTNGRIRRDAAASRCAAQLAAAYQPDGE
ncbi:long-subunit acyl-CoA synthetase (AMP-forming) [Pseudoduganella flava]|uniref:AMP-binding protein n=1 Tax=Pseudoduganella flava TaxID=871742 RepID=A0A562Q107_9BURK|nr:AMP-binding protein [Pseudoduganella flava]QGZ38151.1 AMP-binding protein [Pseudoduganella flava]TWI50328.1 long-subunit acyl-CoA synthetase (AMP-forming) [Pseudoduganella flava]